MIFSLLPSCVLHVLPLLCLPLACGFSAVPLPEGIFVSTQLHVLPVAGQCSPLVVSGAATYGSQREGDAALRRTRGDHSGRSSERTRAQA